MPISRRFWSIEKEINFFKTSWWPFATVSSITQTLDVFQTKMVENYINFNDNTAQFAVLGLSKLLRIMTTMVNMIVSHLNLLLPQHLFGGSQLPYHQQVLDGSIRCFVTISIDYHVIHVVIGPSFEELLHNL